MRNIELKARLRDWAKALCVCSELGTILHGDIRQTDTYFPVPEGRLKLRASDPGEDYLVFYRRADLAGPKACDYLIRPVDRSLRDLLAGALGTLAVVEKTRTLFLWENVRIHLDRVEGLGEFIEFEAVLTDGYDETDGYRKLEKLEAAFEIAAEDRITISYLDMVTQDR